jgi:hypothetical protein
MSVNPTARQGKHKGVFLAGVIFIMVWPVLTFERPSLGASIQNGTAPALYLRIYDWKTGELYVSRPVRVGSTLFFGWIHSLEKIPWNEYYHVDKNLNLVLDAITFPAFGAGIPENKGRICYVENGLIHMEEIDQSFEELVWLNSHTATQEIQIDGNYVTKGSALPQHTRLRLVIEGDDVDEF